MIQRHRIRRGVVISLYVGPDLRSNFVQKVLSPAENWTRVAFRLLVADCPYRPVLCIAPGHPMPDKEIAEQLGVPLVLWKRTKKKLLENGDIEWERGVGIRYAKWQSSNPHDIRSLRAAIRSVDRLPLSEKELRKDLDERRSIIDLYNIITGHRYDPNEQVFAHRFNDRKAEGATTEDFAMVTRKYCWAALKGTPNTIVRMGPQVPLAGPTFWKWVKKDCAMASPIEQMQSTADFIRALPDLSVRKRAWRLCNRYSQASKMERRREGWEREVDVDYRKTMTCKEYVELLCYRKDAIDVGETG